MVKTQQEGFDLNLSAMDFWSASQESFTIPAIAADTALPSVTVVLPTGVTLVRVIAMFKYRKLTAVLASALAGAQDIQVRTDAPGAWADAINLVDDQWTLVAGDIEGGDVLIGNIDVKATVIGNDTYNFQLDEAVADSAMVFSGVQMGLRVWYR